MGAIMSVGSHSARGEISMRAGICGWPRGVVITTRAREVSRSVRVKRTSNSSAPVDRIEKQLTGFDVGGREVEVGREPTSVPGSQLPQ
jgi:hypothetical protein